MNDNWPIKLYLRSDLDLLFWQFGYALAKKDAMDSDFPFIFKVCQK